jgi:hypothetical protein
MRVPISQAVPGEPFDGYVFINFQWDDTVDSLESWMQNSQDTTGSADDFTEDEARVCKPVVQTAVDLLRARGGAGAGAGVTLADVHVPCARAPVVELHACGSDSGAHDSFLVSTATHTFFGRFDTS